MKYVRLEILFKSDSFISSEEWKTIHQHIRSAIEAVKWPQGSSEFLLYPESGKKRGLGSGVKPIKTAFVNKLRDLDWKTEEKIQISDSIKLGKVDAAKKVEGK